MPSCSSVEDEKGRVALRRLRRLQRRCRRAEATLLKRSLLAPNFQRASEFSPSAHGELWNSTRACLDVGSVCSLHVRGHTRAHTQLSTVWQSPHAACSSMQQRAHDLCPCVHAPASCCRESARQLLQAASEFGQPLPRWGYGMCCTLAHRDCDCPQQVPRRAYACRMHLPLRDGEFPMGKQQRAGACCPPKNAATSL